MNKISFIISIATILLLGFPSYCQSYLNGPKFYVYKIVSSDLNENIISSTDVKNVSIDINSKSKIISIIHPLNYIEKYYYNDYNKNLHVKGKYYDIFTIINSKSSRGNSLNTDLLIFTKIPRKEHLTSLKILYQDKGYKSYLFK